MKSHNQLFFCLVTIFFIIPSLISVLSIYSLAEHSDFGYAIKNYKEMYFSLDFALQSLPISLFPIFKFYFAHLILPFMIVYGIYVFKKYGKYKILLFFLISEFALQVIFFIPYALRFFNKNHSINIYEIFTQILVILSIFLSFLGTKYMLQFVKIKTDEQSLPILSNNSDRFINYILDRMICIYSFTVNYSIITIILQNGYINAEPNFSVPFVIFAIALYNNFVYYFSLEAFFSLTPAKLISNTISVDNSNQILNLKNALIKTLCRFIPFDNFSFLLGSNGFHDSVSNTKVLKIE